MSIGGNDFRAAYVSGFRTYLDEPGERTLRAAYELGRDAVRRDLSILDLAILHHEALADALRAGADGEEAERVVRAAADFLVESLSAFEMLQRGFREAREAALLERRHASMLRQLSSLLADASLAFDAAGSLEEMLRLVAEQTRELTRSASCAVSVELGASRVEVASSADADDSAPAAAPGAGGSLEAPLTALDGQKLGSIRLLSEQERHFTELDEAVLVHLAQMTSAAVERVGLYDHRAPR
jgi:Phosphoserine phosphatase RsbU, N-terminal domain